MNELNYNPNPQSTKQTLTDDELAEKRAFLQQQASDIIAIADLQSNSALNCLHKVNVLGGTTEKAYTAIFNRILLDQDSHGAYHAVAMAQGTSDLPFDVPQLIELIINHGEPELQLRLLKLFDNQPVTTPPIPKIKQAILTSENKQVIAKLHQHLAGK